jgi:putative glycosyltransferase
MKLSVVTTLYQSAPYIEAFHGRVSQAASEYAGSDYEIVIVNDGSPDDSLERAVRLSESDPHLIILDLSRNFGHHKAMMTGLAHAQGAHVFLIDSDLEEEPEWLAAYAGEMKAHDADVVYGVQVRRKGGWFERKTGDLFYRLFRSLTGIDLPENVVTARLMTRRYVNALIRHDEREVFLAGLWHITGFRQRPFTVTKHNTSATTYTFGRKIEILVNSVTSFSNAPLRLIFYFGTFISFAAGLYLGYLILNWLLLSRPLSGWTSIMASVWLLGGMIISFLGVIGIYIAKIFSETKRRPYTIIRQIYGQH